MSSRITPPSADTDSTSRRRWTLIIAAVLLVIVLIGAILLIASRGDDPQTAPPPGSQPTGTSTGEPSSAPSETPSSTGPRKCDLPAGPQTIPATPIHGAKWTLVNRYAVPSASDFGPQITDPDGLRRCFAHSPTGAVYAMYNHFAAMSPPDSTSAEATFSVLRRIMTPGPNLDAYIQYLKTADDSGGSNTSVQLAGFKVLDATANRVTMLVAAQANGGYGSSTWTLTWSGGDWKVVSPKQGERAGEPYTSLADLTGFVPWQGA